MKNSGPKISIITITFNDPEGLLETINSLKKILGSTEEWEHIVIDSSPEKNEDILSKIGQWPLVRIQTRPKGIYAAFNLGIESARGEFIWFLNGGDRLSSSENFSAVLNQFDFDRELEMVCGGVDLFRDNKYIYSISPKEGLIENLVGQNNICHQGIIYRRRVFEKIGVFSLSYPIVADYEHHFRCALSGIKAKAVNISIAEFGRGGRSDNFKEVFREYRKIWKKYHNQLSYKFRSRNTAYGLFYYFQLLAMRSKIIRPISRPLKSAWYKINRSK